MLSGYCPSAVLVEVVGKIAREIKLHTATKTGSFFWILDPVMGDNGRIYVAEDTVPVYKSLLRDADLILPNQFEAELLSDVKIYDLSSMKQAITKFHQAYNVPHVLITSIRLPATTSSTPTDTDEDLSTSAKLSIIGSTALSDMKPRLFRITVPALPVFFSGTGDMFASLMAARLRQAVKTEGLLEKANWRSPDEVTGPELPLAKAAETVLASMHAVLKDTAKHYDAAAKNWQDEIDHGLYKGTGDEAGEDREIERHLRLTRAAEVRVIQNANLLRNPPSTEKFKAVAVHLEGGEEHVEHPDDLGVVKVGAGQGAVHQT